MSGKEHTPLLASSSTSKMSSFHERQKSLFNHLKVAEEQYSFSKTNKAETPLDYGVIDRRTYRKLKHEMSSFRGKESIYKRPEAKLRQCLRARTIPDHIKNPKGWKYYDLSDVTPDQMSDSTNTATALAFIREMENREANADMNQECLDEGVFKKPTFHISARVKEQLPIEEEKIEFKSSKVIMPEYVVGRSQKKPKKDIIVNNGGHSPGATKKLVLKLDHLFSCDAEDED